VTTNIQLDPELPDLYRIIDANLNRLKEGIRVIEDCARYLHNNKEIARELKSLRHLARFDKQESLLSSRDSVNDVLRPTQKSELDRPSLQSMLTANFKRAQEASRVLEEYLKLIKPDESETYKQIRYTLYTIEKTYLLSL
jgi:thiamine-phosphate pyrophosphorylase